MTDIMLILKTSANVHSFIVQPVCDRPEVFMPVSRSGQDTRFILEEKGFDPERCRRCRQPRKISFQMPADPLCACVCERLSVCPLW